MSVQAITAALRVKGISSSAKFLLVVLANYADQEMKCWPSQARLSLDMNMTPRHMVRLFKELETKGIIVRKERPRRTDGSRVSALIGLLIHDDTVSLRDETKVTSDADPTCQIVQNQHDTMSPKPSIEPSIEPSARVALPAVEKSAPLACKKCRISLKGTAYLSCTDPGCPIERVDTDDGTRRHWQES
jgi:hypothetical protein